MPHPGELLALLCSTTQPSNAAVGASPYTYTAQDSGSVVVRGGMASSIELIRGGAGTTLNFKEGVVPVVKGDQVKITYIGWWPTVTFFKAR